MLTDVSRHHHKEEMRNYAMKEEIIYLVRACNIYIVLKLLFTYYMRCY
jgi:hypothetical protein